MFREENVRRLYFIRVRLAIGKINNKKSIINEKKSILYVKKQLKCIKFPTEIIDVSKN